MGMTLTFDPERLKAKTGGIVQFVLPSVSDNLSTYDVSDKS